MIQVESEDLVGLDIKLTITRIIKYFSDIIICSTVF
jgi:hypothetical protein